MGVNGCMAERSHSGTPLSRNNFRNETANQKLIFREEKENN